MGDTLTIRFQSGEVGCWACGAHTPHLWSLPVDGCGALAPAGSEAWVGGMPCCGDCYHAHARGLLTEATRGGWARRQALARRAMRAAFRED